MAAEIAGVINGFNLAIRLLVHQLERTVGFDRGAYAELLKQAATDAQSTADPASFPRFDFLVMQNLARLIENAPPSPSHPSWVPTVIEGGLSQPKE